MAELMTGEININQDIFPHVEKKQTLIYSNN